MSSILFIRGPLAGARLQLTEDENCIGRAPQCQIVLNDNTVSRTHAVIRRHRHGWLLEDSGSSAGTLLNARPVTQPSALSPNDEIRVGHSIFLFDSEFDIQNADFTDNSVFFSAPHDDTMAMAPVAVLDPFQEPIESPARHGMELLTEIGELFDSTRTPFGEALRYTTERMSRMLAAETAMLMLYDHGAGELRTSAVIAEGNVLADRSIFKRVHAEKRAVLLSDKPELAGHPSPDAPETPKVRSVLAAPVMVDTTCLGVIHFERHELDAYTLRDLRLVQSLGRLLGVFIEARQRAQALALRINYQYSDSQHIIGGSSNFKRVLEIIRRVAETPATVLLIGETGTGKEILANETHRLSPQGKNGRPFIALNCAAIPENLFESQLFGHEKGAFTGASRMHQGYIEQAQGGTLFLDEIGEMSLALQPKLLRFLQEHTFTRVGGHRVLRAEVRVIAATNRNLADDVEKGIFREDLYHRLNVMPIQIPPLRERREDIQLFAESFCHQYSKKLGRDILGISDEALIQLERYAWPGNIRELANCLERAVLLCDNKVIMPHHLMLGKPRSGSGMTTTLVDDQAPTLVEKATPDRTNEHLRPLSEIEREHIERVMKSVGHNQVRAAEILGIHRNTLRKKLSDYNAE